MHELSIAMSLIETATEQARQHGATRVNAIHLKLGPLSGVVEQALVSAYDLAKEQSAVAEAKLIIEHAPITVFCPTCDARRTVASMQRMCCPVCDTPTGQILSGTELEVTAMEIVT